MKRVLKIIYNLLPFKKQIFYLIKCIFPLPEKIYKHLFFKGTFKINLDKTHSLKLMHYGYQLENEIFWNGIKGWEAKSFKAWIDYCKKSHVIFDIGANTGIYAILAKTVNPVSKVYAFEPVKRIYEKLVYNSRLNSFDINSQCIAVSELTGTERIWDFNLEHPYAASLVKPKNESDIYKHYDIPVISLDDFIEKHGISKIDLIKIDVETGEPNVLKGYSKFFSLHKPVLLIEILYNEIGEQVQSFIESSNIKYDYFFIDEKKGLLKVENIRRLSNVYFNYLLIPKEEVL